MCRTFCRTFVGLLMSDIREVLEILEKCRTCRTCRTFFQTLCYTMPSTAAMPPFAAMPYKILPVTLSIRNASLVKLEELIPAMLVNARNSPLDFRSIDVSVSILKIAVDVNFVS